MISIRTRAANDDSAGYQPAPSIERTNSAACKERNTLVNQLPTTATAPSTPAASNWVAAFHAHDLLKAYDQAEAELKHSGIRAASRLTDEKHLALDKAHADFWGVGPNADYANQLMHTAIFYLGAAVKASPDPAQALRALHAALGMTTTEG